MRIFCLLLEARVCSCVLDYFSCYQICIFLCALLCSTPALLTPASFPSSSPLPRYSFFPPLNIHPFPASWLKSLTADRGTYCLLVGEQSPPQHWKADLRRRHLWSPARHRGTCSLVLLSSCFPLLLTPH